MMRVTLMALGSLVAVATAQSSTTCTEVVKTEDVRELLAMVLSRCEGKAAKCQEDLEVIKEGQAFAAKCHKDLHLIKGRQAVATLITGVQFALFVI